MAIDITPLYFVRPDEDYVRTATMSASSEQEGYEAAKAKTDNPDEPWWADSTTAGLTATFAEGGNPLGVVAVIMNNADDGAEISITAGTDLIGPLIAAREASGYPKDVAVLADPVNSIITANAVTVQVSGVTSRWSVGRLVAGKVRTIHNFLDSASPSTQPWRGQEIDQGIPTYGSDIRYDTGVEHLVVEGTIMCETDEDVQELHDWYASTRMGFYPTLVIFHDNRYPPIWARMQVGKRVMKEGHVNVPVTFVTMGRGIEIIDPGLIDVEILP